MNIQLLKNSDASLVNTIRESLEWAETAKIGVAYGTYATFDKLKGEFEKFLRNDGKLRILFDIEKFITERRIIEEFATIPGDSECKVFIKPEEKNAYPKSYHPKFYLFYNDDEFRVIVGSSNFTLGGLFNNLESNLFISGERGELFETFEDFFSELWNLEYAINVLHNDELFNAYEEVSTHLKNENQKAHEKFDDLKRNLFTETEQIIDAKRNLLNEEFSYLLGLMSANSEIDWENNQLTIELYRQTVNAGEEYEGEYYFPEVSNYRIDQEKAHRKDIDWIVEKIDHLIKFHETNDTITTNHIKDLHFQIIVNFDEDSVLWNELKKYNIPQSGNKVQVFVPENILESDEKKIITPFLQAYLDLKSRITISDSIYKRDKETGKPIFSNLRIGISFPHNIGDSLDNFESLFNKIGIDKGMSITDPEKRTRENLIRIDVRKIPNELIGTHWRRIFLRDFKYYMENEKTKYTPDS